MTAATLARTAQAGKYLAFELARERYAVEILRVQEISTAAGVKPVPGQPSCASGVIRLRGRTIPVVSMRRRMGLAGETPSSHACVVVVDVITNSGIMPLGLLVDAVTEVCHFTAEAIDGPPGAGGGLEDGDWIAGFGNSDGERVCLIEVDRLLGAREREQIVRIAGAAAS
jgi:purine-binding chemotaxis protein CheW